MGQSDPLRRSSVKVLMSIERGETYLLEFSPRFYNTKKDLTRKLQRFFSVFAH